jgi:hypothetical protein
MCFEDFRRLGFDPCWCSCYLPGGCGNISGFDKWVEHLSGSLMPDARLRDFPRRLRPEFVTLMAHYSMSVLSGTQVK